MVVEETFLLQSVVKYNFRILGLKKLKAFIIVENEDGDRFWAANGKLKNEFINTGQMRRRTWGMFEVRDDGIVKDEFQVQDEKEAKSNNGKENIRTEKDLVTVGTAMRSEEEKEIELRAESKKPSEEGNKEEKEIELRAESKEPSKEGSKEVQQELNMILDDISSDESDIEFKESDQSQLDQAECKPERLVLSGQKRKTLNYSDPHLNFYFELYIKDPMLKKMKSDIEELLRQIIQSNSDFCDFSPVMQKMTDLILKVIEKRKKSSGVHAKKLDEISSYLYSILSKLWSKVDRKKLSRNSFIIATLLFDFLTTGKYMKKPEIREAKWKDIPYIDDEAKNTSDVCFFCNIAGHKSFSCPAAPKLPKKSIRMEEYKRNIKCFECKGRGHMAAKCPTARRPRYESRSALPSQPQFLMPFPRPMLDPFPLRPNNPLPPNLLPPSGPSPPIGPSPIVPLPPNLLPPNGPPPTGPLPIVPLPPNLLPPNGRPHGPLPTGPLPIGPPPNGPPPNGPPPNGPWFTPRF